MKIHFISIIAILFIVLQSVTAQEKQVHYLNLDSAIAIAKRQSYDMRMLKERVDQSELQLKSIMRGFLPGLNMNTYVPNYIDDVESLTDSTGTHYYPTNRSTVSGNLQLSQVLPTDGKLSIQTEMSNARDLFHKNKLTELTTGIKFDQPIEALYVYNQMRSSYKQAKLQHELASKQFKRQELELIYNISEAFYAVVAAGKRKEIADQNLKRQEETYKTAKSKFEAGLIREVEALQIEVDLGEAVNQADFQATNFTKQLNLLKQEMGIPLTDSITTEHQISYVAIVIDPQKAVDYGLKNRPEIREKEIQVKMSEIQIKRQKAQNTISGNISAYVRFVGKNKYPLNYSDFNAFDETYNAMMNRQASKGVALSLKIPILDWGSNRSLVRLQKSRLVENKIQLDYQMVQIENEIRNMVGTISSNLRRLQLLEKNVKLAEKSYNISYQRFNNGDIDAEALGLDRSRYNNAQQSYLEAYISYKLGLLDLNRRTFYDFENNKSFVDEAQ